VTRESRTWTDVEQAGRPLCEMMSGRDTHSSPSCSYIGFLEHLFPVACTLPPIAGAAIRYLVLGSYRNRSIPQNASEKTKIQQNPRNPTEPLTTAAPFKNKARANPGIVSVTARHKVYLLFLSVVHQGRGEDAASPRGEECVCNIKNLSLVKFVPKNDKKSLV
jgi:hypothetical protein